VSYRETFATCLILAAWTGAASIGAAASTALAATAACEPGAPAPKVTVAAAEAGKKQILEVIGHMQNAWNRGDFRGYMQGFKNPDVIFVSGGRFQNGWQGTLEHYIRDYGASPELRGTLRFYDIQVEILSPDAAQLISRYELKRAQHPQYGINTRLMRKVGGHWVIALNHVSSSETAPSVASPANPQQ
jgi:opacity protein-like surface antigen